METSDLSFSKYNQVMQRSYRQKAESI